MSNRAWTLKPKIDRCGPSGKVRYRSQGAADVALERARTHAQQPDNRNRHLKRHEQRAYGCHLCGGFHLTSRPL